MDTWLKRIGLGVLVLAILGAVAVFAIDAHVQTTAGPRIVTADEAAVLGNVDCVLVLGCGVHPDGCPSDMLADRIAQGVALYENGTSPKLLMSGDHGRADYDEVNAMREMAVQAGLPADDVFMDHAGFSTYESMYRARDVFGAKRIVIVSQKYHLYRALYVAERLGLDAYGVSADLRPYAGQEARELREVLARNKDFFTAIVQPPPTPHLAFRQRQRHRGLRWQGREHATWRCAVMVEAFEFSSYGPTRVVAKATLHTI